MHLESFIKQNIFRPIKKLLKGSQYIAPLSTPSPAALFADVKIDATKMSSFRFEQFPYEGPYPWLDQPDALEQISEKVKSGRISEADAALCKYWIENGYIILKNAINAQTLDDVWAAYEKSIQNGTITLQPEKICEEDPHPGRYLDPHMKVPEICNVMRHPEILRWIQLLMDRTPAPFQTITCHKGSQQGEHSDSIHMTTYPLGYLTAAWIAFEDIHPDCGPLVYYPGSHRWPYIFSKDVGISEKEFQEKGYAIYHERYEPKIKELIEKYKIPPHYFHAEKGDVLIWHANLVHGGSPRKNPLLSRHALVCHYFVEGAVCYHDLASLPSRPFAGTCLLRNQH